VRLRHPGLSVNQPDLLSNVRAWMGELSPGISLEVQNYPGIQKASVAYEYDTGPEKRFTSLLRPTNVGFGITYAFPIVVAVLSAKTGDTLLVENPEAHLHPGGQFKIGRMLALTAAGGVQVFVETHSEHVLNGARIAVKNGICLMMTWRSSSLIAGPVTQRTTFGSRFQRLIGTARSTHGQLVFLTRRKSGYLSYYDNADYQFSGIQRAFGDDACRKPERSDSVACWPRRRDETRRTSRFSPPAHWT